MRCHSPLHSSASTSPASTYIEVLNVHKAAPLQQQADSAHVAARSRQVQRGAALGVADLDIVLRVLQQSRDAGRVRSQMLSILGF